MKRVSTALLLGALAVCLASTVKVAALPYPGSPTDETEPSLGQFQIYINNAVVRALLAGSPPPGYNPVAFTFTSPMLSDPLTKIGLSASLIPGSAADIAGVPVGSAGTMVKDGDLTPPAGFGEPGGGSEVHTQIVNLNLTGSGLAVRAGSSAPDRPNSVGEVEATGATDFPAQSFFDVFVDVDIPGLGTVANPNNKPLQVMSTLTDPPGLPPKVVYIHGNTTAVPVYFTADGPGSAWLKGDLLGQLTLAGHGIQFDGGNPADVAAFENNFFQETPMFLDPNVQQHTTDLPEPTSTFALLAVAVLPLLGFRRQEPLR
jgi:hypothetical protein